MVADVVMGVEARASRSDVVGRIGQLDQRWALFVALVVLNVFDIVTTEAVLARGGRETNPILEPLVDSMLTVSMLKAVVLVIVGCLLLRCRPSKLIDFALVITTGWYGAVVAWNVTVLALL